MYESNSYLLDLSPPPTSGVTLSSLPSLWLAFFLFRHQKSRITASIATRAAPAPTPAFTAVDNRLGEESLLPPSIVDAGSAVGVDSGVEAVDCVVGAAACDAVKTESVLDVDVSISTVEYVLPTS